jgi:hypothetical protein
MITSINEFRNHYNSINEMSYASLQGEIDAFTAQLAELGPDADPKQIEILKRKIQTRQNYIDRLKSGRKSNPKTLNVGEPISFQNREYTIVAITDADVVLANETTTYQGKPVRITNVEGDNIFINTSNDKGGFNNFAKKITIADLQGLTTVSKSMLGERTPKEPRAPREPKVKANPEIKQAVKILQKNIESVQPSIDKFKDRSPEQQAQIFQKRFNMPFTVDVIVQALNAMGLYGTEVTEA